MNLLTKHFIIPTTVFLISFLTRTHRIENGKFVVWHESHFGKFSANYLTQTSYFDVHPPLGKMLTSLAGYLSNQNPKFKFKSADAFEESFDYVGMRRFHAIISSFTPLLAYLILREIGYSLRRSAALSFLFIFENGFTSIGRLILLDSHLLTATACVVYLLSKLYFRSYMKNMPMNILDYRLLGLGIAIGCALSIKWIGCLTMSFVGIIVIWYLWSTLNSKTRLVEFLLIFIKHSLYLILLPVFIYTSLFYLHFKIVNKAGPDDASFSSLFQKSNIKDVPDDTRMYIPYGSTITIKSKNGGYLHSHKEEYPSSNLGQLTTYAHIDENNSWVFQKVSEETKNVKYVMDGDKIVLYHLQTQKYVFQAKSKSFLSNNDFLVGTKEGRPTNRNVFIVEIVTDIVAEEDKVKAITTMFHLKNLVTGCYLKNTARKYPSWGFSQEEVSCTAVPDEDCLWNVDGNSSNRFSVEENPLISTKVRISFLHKLIEYNRKMYLTNKSFEPSIDLEPARISSTPIEWPFLKRGLRMVHWENNERPKFYMFGNPIIFYSCLFSIFISLFLLIYKIAKRLRKQKIITKGKPKNNQKKNISFLHRDLFELFIGVIGWAFHYIPFFFAKRVLYFHHYYPALFFSMFSLAYTTRLMSFRILSVFIGVSILSYIAFSPLTYGFFNVESLRFLKIIPTWDFVE